MSSAFVVSTLVGVTIATGLGLTAAALARRGRAASRHVLLTASLGVSVLLPIFVAVMPSIRIDLPIANATPDQVGPATVDVDVMEANAAAIGAAPESVTPPPQFSWPSLSELAIGCWLAGMIVVAAPMWAGLRQMRWLRRTALPWTRGQMVADEHAGMSNVRRVAVLLHESVAGPVTCGVRRAVVVLPIDADTWSRADLDRALVHELEHVRRHDWLTQCLARTLCACYWFHPLVWMTRRQIALEAERACDDAVLGAGVVADATAYADQLVGLAKRLSAAAHQPLIAMADRRDLSTRVRALLDASQPRGRASAVLLATVAAAALGLVITLSPLRMVVGADGQTLAADAPRFEVASVRPCQGTTPTPDGRAGGPGPLSSSPGRLHIECAPLLGADGLIRLAYAKFANGQVNRYWAFLPIVGGPAWATSERFTIDAKAPGEPSLQMMKGPMLQALLVEGFHLKTHRETRQVPIYELSVAKGGPKLRAFAGQCTPIDFAKDIPAQLEANGSCVFVAANHTWDAPGQTIDDFIKTALSDLDRPVVNASGLEGRFDFHLDLTPDDSAASPDRITTVAVALQRQLGLTLKATTGPADFLVIDAVDRPAPGGVSFQAPASAPASAGATAGKQKFDAVSIKPCQNEPPTPPGQRSSQGGFPTTSPGHFVIECGTVERLISVAYVRFGEALTNQDARIGDISWMKGAPSWVRSDKFTIEATASGAPDDSVMRGPMLRALLEDRFKLQVRRVTEEAPMYALTIAKGGLRINPMAPGDCVEYDASNPPDPRGGLQGKPICHGMSMGGGPGRMVWNAGGDTLQEFAHTLSAWMDRYVIDRTGVTDTFNIRLEYAPDEHTPGPDKRGPARTDFAEPNAPSIFQALEQQLGLKLEPTKGPQTAIVIDHIERPTPDKAPLSKPTPPARAKGPGR